MIPGIICALPFLVPISPLVPVSGFIRDAAPLMQWDRDGYEMMCDLMGDTIFTIHAVYYVYPEDERRENAKQELEQRAARAVRHGVWKIKKYLEGPKEQPMLEAYK